VKVISHKLQDERFGTQWDDEVHYLWDYRDFYAHENWRRGTISFDCLLWDQNTQLLHAGITSFNEEEITKAFDRKTGKFIDTGFAAVAAPYDAKFHRSFIYRKKDGCYYSAIALLHNVDEFLDAPGGAICRYDPKAGRWEKLCIPLEHVYIQNITYDEKCDCLYLMTFAPEYLLRYDLGTGKIHNYGLIGSGIAGMAQCESTALDDDGTLWGCWRITRAWSHDVGANDCRLFRVRAGAERIEYLPFGIPKRDGSFGYEKPESFFNLGDGAVYASAANGSLYRIDPKTAKAAYLFTPISDRRSRLSALALDAEGRYAYGVTGRDGKCQLIKLDVRKETYELSDIIRDEQGEPCWQIHHVVMTKDGVLFAGENDIPHRSGYLWEIHP
jgi:hypothetical protein